MTERELKELFEAAAPSELQRERMLRNILNEKGDPSSMDNNVTEKKRSALPLRALAAVLALCLVCAACFQLFGASPLTMQVYAMESGAEITDQWLQGGHLNDDGSGDGVLFYLTGEGIDTVRFTTENQYLTFKDWTDQREQVWRSQDFTVDYGPEAADYDKLVLYWDPFDAWELLHDENMNVADLPEELRHDTITMTATFANGKTLTQVLEIQVEDNGEVSLTLAK